jgi:hypothetical protein
MVREPPRFTRGNHYAQQTGFETSGFTARVN